MKSHRVVYADNDTKSAFVVDAFAVVHPPAVTYVNTTRHRGHARLFAGWLGAAGDVELRIPG